jgi:hypothetical protein
MLKKNRIQIHNETGYYVAEIEAVSTFIKEHSRRWILAECWECYNKTFTKKELRGMPTYILAVIRCQI